MLEKIAGISLNKTKKRKLGLVLILFGLFFFVLGGVLTFFRTTPLEAPISSSTLFQFLGDQAPPHPHAKIVYGFMPYWNIDKVTIQPELTHLAYFSLTFDSAGNVISANSQDGSTEMGLSKLKSDSTLSILQSVNKNHSHNEVVLSQFDNDQISQFLMSPAAQDRLISNLDEVLQAYPFEGVNIDIEYTGQVTANLRGDLTTFMNKLHSHLQQKFAHVALSIDVFAGAGSDTNVWDIKSIAASVDHIIIMAYDFHRKSSMLAGPVAPLFGGQKFWDGDITHYIKDFLDKVPSSKIVLGVPFYGYEWQTVSDDPQAQTFPTTGSMASVEQVQEILNQKDTLHVEERWNEEALSPYLVFKKDGKTYLIYYENSRSLSYKLDLVNQLDLGGIAIWALGYEKDSRELWDVIHKKI